MGISSLNHSKLDLYQRGLDVGDYSADVDSVIWTSGFRTVLPFLPSATKVFLLIYDCLMLFLHSSIVSNASIRRGDGHQGWRSTDRGIEETCVCRPSALPQCPVLTCRMGPYMHPNPQCPHKQHTDHFPQLPSSFSPWYDKKRFSNLSPGYGECHWGARLCFPPRSSSTEP